MSEGGDIFGTVKTTADILREAEILTLRQMASSLQALTTEMTNTRTAIGAIQLDLAVVKERQAASAELRSTVAKIEDEIDALKSRNAQQDGAYSFVGVMKDFGPWLVSLLILAWGLFERRP